MPSYTTGRKNHWPYILRQWSIPVAIFLIIILYDQFFPNDFIDISDTFYWIGAILLLTRLIDLTRRERIYKIEIDETAKNITQYYRSPFSGAGEKIYTLSKMRLYTKTRNTGSAADTITRSLKLYKDHREIIRLDTHKDGFTPQTLQEIREALIRLGVQT